MLVKRPRLTTVIYLFPKPEKHKLCGISAPGDTLKKKRLLGGTGHGLGHHHDVHEVALTQKFTLAAH